MISISLWAKTINHAESRWSITRLLTEMEREGLFIHYISICFQNVLLFLAVLAQVIPGGSESPFRAAGLRRCRAWNPITSAAMLALWHQAPSMQNATAWRLPAKRAPQFSYCRGVFTDGWSGWQGAGAMARVTLMRGKVESSGKRRGEGKGQSRNGEWGWWFYLIVRVCNYYNSRWKTVPPGRRNAGET